MIIERDLEQHIAAHSPLSLAFEQAERELGARIGYPALVYHKAARRVTRYSFDPSRDGGSDIIDEDRPIRDTDIVDRLNEQDDDLQRVRAELAEARGHIRSLTKGGKVAHAAAWMLRQIVRNKIISLPYTHDEARIMVMCYEDTGFNIAVADAIQWLAEAHS